MTPLDILRSGKGENTVGYVRGLSNGRKVQEKRASRTCDTRLVRKQAAWIRVAYKIENERQWKSSTAEGRSNSFACKMLMIR